ncbi:hypothetical protein LSAT2_031297 [Lamellibrachia satsuma]|nr:hypothetical protein LSAT2_031297 [Lamellibrachia satsuma]
MAFRRPVTLSFHYDPEAVQESSKMLVLCSETDVDEPMCWKEHKPPAECTEDGSTKTCSIVTKHFTAYALVIQKAVTAIMPATVAAIDAAMLDDAWSGGTTELVVMSAAVGLKVALIRSALWSHATTVTAAMYQFLFGSPLVISRRLPCQAFCPGCHAASPVVTLHEACRWTFSTDLLFFSVNVSHTVVAYSTIGLMKV